MFFDAGGQAERLVFPDWKPKTYDGVPFVLVDPQGDRVKNAVMLHGPQRDAPAADAEGGDAAGQRAGRRRSTCWAASAAGAARPRGERPGVSMIVRLHYDDGKTEDHPLQNGVHLADYSRRVDVPGSEFAFQLGDQQVRYLAVTPKRPDAVVKSIELVKGHGRHRPGGPGGHRRGPRVAREPVRRPARPVAPGRAARTRPYRPLRPTRGSGVRAVMRATSIGLAFLPLLAGSLAQAQPPSPPPAAAQAPPVEDFKPASSNQPGKQYPQVNSERRARFRIVAPEAKSVRVPEWGGVTLTKGEDGAWVGTTRPLDEGFHYYRINIDGADVPDPGSKFFYGASRWGSGIEIPAHDADFYAVKNVPHGQLRRDPVLLQEHQRHPPLLRLHAPRLRQGHRQAVPGAVPAARRRARTRPGGGVQGRANLILDNLIAAGKAKPFIIVMDNGGVGGPRPGGPGKAGGPAGKKEDGGRPGQKGPGGPPKFDFSAFAKIMTEELIPFIDANYRTLADQPHRGHGRAVDGRHADAADHPGQPRQVLAHRDVQRRQHRRRTTPRCADPAAFKQKVKVLFVSYGSREAGGAATAKANQAALEKLGVKSVYYESPETAHEWQSWRRSLYQFAPLLFRD